MTIENEREAAYQRAVAEILEVKFIVWFEGRTECGALLFACAGNAHKHEEFYELSG